MKRVLLLTALVIPALAVALAWHRSYSDHEHERFQAGVWRLKHLDATFNEDLLRARFSLLESYDDFERYLREMGQITEALEVPPRFVDAKGRAGIAASAEKFATLLRERQGLFERFKSRNAILANSRRYFPVAVTELARRLGEAASDRELSRTIQEVTGVLLANAASADDLRADASSVLDQMVSWAARNPSHPESRFVSSLVRHAHQLLVGKSELDTLTRELLALPAAAEVEQLSHLYELELATALHRTHQYRTFLYALGGLLVAVAAYAFWALRDANRGLEVRVKERTAQLQAEVQERKRAEIELQSSEAFLNSLVENLPVYVFRKDRAGKITFANKLFCDRFRLRRDQVIGITGLELLAAADREKQQRLDEEIMAGGRTYEATDEPVQLHGESSFIHIIKVPVFDSTGRCVGVQGMFLDVTQRKRAEIELTQLHRRLLETSRQAGMAEVATGVLHNVGNVLNSVNVSATLVIDRIRESKAANLIKLGAILREHKEDMPRFLIHDPKGQRVPEYLLKLADQIEAERKTMTGELESLRKNVEHIKDIVAMQQNYAKVSGVFETVAVAELVEDALQINASALARHGLEIVREFGPNQPVTVERHKVLQILVNLLQNAKHACDDSGRPDKQVTVRIARDAARVRVSIIDNGIGIPAENLTRIFAHGFTTKKNGHGFGLHSGALAAKELGGSLTAHSDGPGHGAAFTLELPERPVAKAA
jgi:PAS domain S-box-containing protein